MNISVVIPLYNKAEHIQRSVDSVLAQTYRDFELLVVDDGSVDGSGDIVREYADSRIRVIVQANAGPGAARNRGLREARGEYIAFLDADDEWLPTYLEEQLRFFEKYGDEVSVVCALTRNYQTGDFYMPADVRSLLRERPFRLTPDMPKDDAYKILCCILWWVALSRTECLRKHGGFFDRERCSYGEDLWLSFEVFFHEPIVFNLKVLHVYHIELSDWGLPHRHDFPIEPFFLYHEELEADCPQELRGHLQYLLAMYAFRSATILGSCHQFEKGRFLLRQFHCRSQLPLHRYIQGWFRTSRTFCCVADVLVCVKRRLEKVKQLLLLNHQKYV
jgi:glycosyltransferase involved in cell wall biosynthesis